MSTEPTPQQPSNKIEQVVGGNKNQAIGEMSGGTVFGTIEGKVSIIYNYNYYSESVGSEFVESTDAAGENIPCPYRGLFHFSPNDAEYFFGREVFIEELFAATKVRNFIPVLGASGSGKSSVVLAGLVPKLLNEGHWLFTHFRPGSDPFHALALALVPLYTPDLNATERIAQARQLAKYLYDGDVPLADVFAQIHQNHPTQRVLLIADQFEELYTECVEQKTHRSFLDTLLASFESSPSQSQYSHVLVVTMRVDFLGNALSYATFGDLLRKTDIKIRSMNHEELTQVIEKPADKLGVTFQEGLVKRILDDVDSEPGNLPLLEFALTELWKRRKGKQLTHAAYEDIGEVKGALARHADENYRKFNETEQEQVRRIFIQLVHPGEETKDTRRLATRKDIGEENWNLVKRLADVRLVITNTHLSINSNEQPVEEETVEIVHEAMIAGWFRLQEWLNLDRKFRVWQEQMRTSMRQWRDTRQDEGALLQGAPLSTAEAWLQERPQEISSDGRYFIKRSIQVRDRKRRRAIYGLTGFSVIVTVLAGVAGFAAIGQVNEKINAQIALSQSQFALNQRLDALTQGIKAVKELQKLQNFGVANGNTKEYVVGALPQFVYGVRERNRFDGHTKKVEGVSVSPEGLIVSGGEDSTIKIWNRDGKLLKTLKEHKSWVNKISFSPDGTLMATASSDNTVKLWSFECTNSEGDRCLKVKVELLKTLTQTDEGHSHWVTDVSFSPDRTNLVTASRDGTVKIWNQNGVLQKTISVSNNSEINEVWGVSFSPDGRRIAAAYGDTTVKLFNLDGSLQQTLRGHSKRVRSVSFSSDGKLIVSGSDDNTAIIWRRQDGKLLKRLKGHKGNLNQVKFSRDSKLIATASDGDNENVKLWDIDGTLLTTFNGHQDRVKDVSFTPDSNMLITGSWDNTVRLWNLKGLFPDTFEDHNERVVDLAWSPDGKIFASASWDKTVHLRRYNGKLINKPKHPNNVNAVSFSPYNKRVPTLIATADSSGNIYLWQEDGTPYKSFKGHDDYIRAVAWSPDSQILATAAGEKDRTVKLWSRDGNLLKTLEGHKDGVYGVSFSPNGKIIATSSKDNTVKLWSRDGNLLKTLKGHNGWVWNVAWSPDGKLIASASEDETVKLWKRDGTLENTLRGHTARVSDVTFSGDGKFIATGSADATIKFWTKDGRLLNTLEGHKNRIMSVSFSPDGKTLVSSSVDGAVKLWNLKNLELTSNLDVLLAQGCDWASDYLRTNRNIEKNDRFLCP